MRARAWRFDLAEETLARRALRQTALAAGHSYRRRGAVLTDLAVIGVWRHFPGEPKAGYVTPWEGTPEWEREAAGAVCAQVRQFVEVSAGKAGRLSREQKGRFVATCWTAQMYKHFEEPKPGYVADWSELPEWQRETDADIFEAIERDFPLS